MILEFENRNGIRRVIAEPKTIYQAQYEIRKFLERCNFKSPYTRIVFGENEWTFDVGSHAEFFYLSDLVPDAREQLHREGGNI